MLTNTQVFETVLRYRSESEGLGPLAGDLDKVAVGGVKAEAGMAGLLGTLATAALPIALVTTAVSGLGFALTKVTRDAAAATEDLRKRGLLGEEDARKIDTAARSIDGVSVAVSRMKATVASGLSGFTDSLFTGITGVLMGMNQLVREGSIEWGKLADEVGRATGKLKDPVVTSAFFVETPAQSREWEARQRGSTLEEEARLAREAEERRQAREAAERARLLAEQTLAAGQQGANARMGGVQGGNQSADHEATLEALEALQQHKIALHEDELARVAELQDAQMEASRAAQQHAQDLAAQHRQNAEIARNAWTTAAVGIVSALGPALAKSEAGQKRAALLTIAVNTGAAIAQAFGHYGPTPAGYLQAGAMAVMGATQYAAASAGQLAGAPSGGGGASGAEKPDHYRAESYSPSAQGVYGGGGDGPRGVRLTEDLTLVRDLHGWLDRERRRMRLDRQGG